MGGLSVKVKKVNQWGLGTKFKGVGGSSVKVKKVNQWGLGTKSLKSARRVRKWVELARTIYIRCIYGIFGTKDMVIYGENIRFWPTLEMGEEEVKK